MTIFHILPFSQKKKVIKFTTFLLVVMKLKIQFIVEKTVSFWIKCKVLIFCGKCVQITDFDFDF